MNTQVSHRDIGRPLDEPLQTFDLPPLIEKIKSEAEWSAHERNAMTLHKSPGLRVMLVSMHARTEIARHTAACPMSLLVVEGSVRLTAGDKTVSLQRGQLLTLHAGIPPRLEAPEEASFLLTLAADHPSAAKA